MNNTQMPELTDEQYIEIFSRPDYQFNEWLVKVVAGEVNIITPDNEAAFNRHFPEAKNGVLRYMFYAFAAGMQAAANLLDMCMSDEESPVDTATTTETAK